MAREVYRFLTIVAWLWGSSSLSANSVPPAYILTDLGVAGANFSRAMDVNNSGQVAIEAGNSTSSTVAVVWQNGTFVTAGTLGGDYATAVGISDDGTIVGGSRTSTSIFSVNAYRWREGAGFTDLGRPSFGNSNNFASGISGNGQYIAGTSNQAYRYEGGIYTQLLSPINTAASANDVNNAGTVVGSGAVATGSNQSRALYWPLGQSAPVVIGLVYVHPGVTNNTSLASAINNQGIVTGYSGSFTGFSRGFIYDPVSGAVDLGAPFGRSSFPTDINEHGLIVGYASTTSAQRAVVWDNDAARTAYDLNLLIPQGTGWQLTQAWGMNDGGQIVGSGQFGGQTRAFLLTPIPEPTCLSAWIVVLLVATRHRTPREERPMLRRVRGKVQSSKGVYQGVNVG